MTKFLDALVARQHLIVVGLSLWLVLTSPWVSMLRTVPREPGFFDIAHLGVGSVAFVIGLIYLWDCLRGGRWRLNFPWASGEWRVVVTDLAGLFRGRVPAAESGGLFGAISGLTLIAFVAVAATGIGWWWAAGTPAALDWRSIHLLAVRALVGLALLHILAWALHLLDFVRD